jgi:putative peptidoglycan lipid II flippase
MQKEQRGIVKSAFFSAVGTILSRITGLLRETVMAAIFGTGLVADAFSAAFRFPNLLLRVFGENGLRVVMMPRYTQESAEKGETEAFILASSVAVVMSVIIGIVIIGGVVFAPWFALLFAHGWQSQPEKFDLTVKLLRLLFPYIGLMALATWASVVLNAHNKFFIPALSPAFMNLGWMIGGFIVLYQYKSADYYTQSLIIGVGVLIGGALQFLVQLPSMKKIGFKFIPRMRQQIPNIKEMGVLLTPTLGALVIAETSFLVDLFLASYLPEGSVSALTYANKLIFLPMGFATVSIATASLPKLSEFAAKKENEKFSQMLSFSFRTTLGIMIPITAYILALATPIVKLLLERGSFDAVKSTPMTVYAVSMYAIGLYAYSAFRILAQGFYALKDTKTPVINAAIQLSINIVLNLLFIGPLKHGGLALATSLSAIIQVFMLMSKLQKRGYFDTKSELISIFRLTALSTAVGVLTYLAYRGTLLFISGDDFASKTVILGIPSLVWAGGIVALAYIFKVSEIKQFLDLFVAKLVRKYKRKTEENAM